MGIREALLNATTPTEVVQLPEIGASVTVRGMTGRERDAFEASCVKGTGKKRTTDLANIRAKLVAFCCLDEHGNRAFSEDEAEALGNVRGDVINRLFTVAQRLSGLSQEDVDELGQGYETTTASSTASSVSPSR